MNPAPPMTSTATAADARRRVAVHRVSRPARGSGRRGRAHRRESWRRRRPPSERAARRAPTTPATTDASTTRTAADRRRRAAATEPVTVAPAPTRARLPDDAAVDDGVGVDVGVGGDGLARPRPGPPTVDEVEVGLQVQLGATGVDPVVVGRHRVEPPAGGEQRERVALDRHPPAGGMRVEHARLEHVRAGVDQVARLGARRRLLDEAQRCGRPASSSTTPNADGSSTGIRWIVASALGGAVHGDEVGDRRGRSARRRWRRRTCRRCRRGRRRSGSRPAVSSGSGSMA